MILIIIRFCCVFFFIILSSSFFQFTKGPYCTPWRRPRWGIVTSCHLPTQFKDQHLPSKKPAMSSKVSSNYLADNEQNIKPIFQPYASNEFISHSSTYQISGALQFLETPVVISRMA